MARVIAAWLAASLTASFTVGLAAQPVDDSDIARAVASDLARDPVVAEDGLGVSVDDGIVRLSGTAKSLLVRDRAVQVAQMIRGVRAVIPAIDISTNPDLGAPGLEGDVSAALLADPAADSWQIEVNAEAEGAVLLTGTVDSWAEKQMADQIARGVLGVTKVVNQLTVAPDQDRLDKDIHADIRSNLEWDLLVDADQIDVSVRDGVVRLSGAVGSAVEKAEAVYDASVVGVREVVEDELTVEPWAQEPNRRLATAQIRTDRAITEAVRAALRRDPRLSRLRLTPTVTDGVVTLTGVVPSLQAKRIAEQDARRTVGVRAVTNALEVMATEDPVTAEQRIAAALARSAFLQGSEVRVTVRNGTARLTGQVQRPYQRQQAEALAGQVAGIQAVQTDIAVATPDPLPQDAAGMDRTDREIADAIQTELFWSAVVDVGAVNVSVSDGVARLSGQVSGWPARRAAVVQAYEGGAREVVDALRIARPGEG
ncbi:MAG: BON domain-containing protein [Rhodothalassiaceae bacterium]